jgi:ketosteroid isomerase-like protein
LVEGNLEIVRRLYDLINAGDLEAAGALVHDDVEWIPDSRVGLEPARGRLDVIRFFQDRADTFEQLHTEPERFWEKDDRIVVFVRASGRGRGSGAEFEIRIGHVWTLRDGLVARGEVYGDRDKALSANGLSD